MDYEDESHYRRCDQLIKKLKGIWKSTRRDSEGVDDINTYGVLSVEGFLPGYGLDVGAVKGYAEIPYWQMGNMEFELPRPTGVAVREYVPGNLIYANGHRFVARVFHREPSEEQSEIPTFEINLERSAITETTGRQSSGSLDGTTLRAIPICDVNLIHQSQISDEEKPLGYQSWCWEKNRTGIMVERITTGSQQLLRRSVHLRMVNRIGSIIEQTNEFGYPVCRYADRVSPPSV